MPPEVEVAMFHLDYLSCFLTILATVLVFRTSQFGFIPANLICICVYAFSIRSWVKKTHTHRIRPAMGVGTTETTMVISPYTPIVSKRGVFCESKKLSHHCGYKRENL